jgi:hypothetical protein
MLRSNLLTTLQTLISNQINISVENLNGEFIWLQIKNLLKNFSKDKKPLWGSQTQDKQLLLL